MPTFAANLSTQFNEVPFLQRFAAAAQAGFDAVEFLFPYDYPAEQLKTLLDDNGLKLVLFNTAPGNVAAGEWGFQPFPAGKRRQEPISTGALDYALALDCPQVHIMAATVPSGADRQQYVETFIR
ncbi:TIM barrel protein [Pantoea ananatis]